MKFQLCVTTILALLLSSMSLLRSQDVPAGTPPRASDVAPTASGQPIVGESPPEKSQDSKPSKDQGAPVAANEKGIDRVVLIHDEEILLFSEKDWTGSPITIAQLTKIIDGRHHVLVKANSETSYALIQKVLEALSKTGANVSVSSSQTTESDLGIQKADSDSRLGQLTKKLVQIEKNVRDIQRQINATQLFSTGELSTQRKESFERELRDQVTNAFDLRQELQRAELTEIRGRLSRIEAQISAREQSKHEIVEGRVQEFMANRSGSKLGLPIPLEISSLGIKVVPVLEVVVPKNSPTFLSHGGLRIVSLISQAPAMRAGLRIDDILIGLGNYETISVANVDYVVKNNSNSYLTFIVIRGDAVLSGTINIVPASSLDPLRAATDPPSTLPSLPSSNATDPFAAAPRSSGGASVAMDGKGSVILQSPTEFQESFRSAMSRLGVVESAIESLRQGLREKSKTDSPTIDDVKRKYPLDWKDLEVARERVQLVRDEYAAQIKMLELEQEAAQRAAQTAKEKFDVTKSLFDGGQISVTIYLQARQESDSAAARLDQAKTLLDLYRKIRFNEDQKANDGSRP